VGVTEGHPMLRDLPEIDRQCLAFLGSFGIEAGQLVLDQVVPVPCGHSSSQEANQVVVLLFSEVVCQFGKGLSCIVRYIPVSEIMVFILSLHGFFRKEIMG